MCGGDGRGRAGEGARASLAVARVRENPAKWHRRRLAVGLAGPRGYYLVAALYGRLPENPRPRRPVSEGFSGGEGIYI